MSVLAVVIGVAGLALLTATALAWTGRWRAWSRRFPTAGLPMPLTLLPGLGLALLGAAAHEADVVSSGSPVAALSVLCLFAGIALYLWAPRWWGPRWYRQLDPAAVPDLQDPLTAFTYATVRGQDGGPDGDAAPARVGTWGPPSDGWRAGWVREDGWVVGGTLSLHAEGLAFQPTGMNRRLSPGPTSVVVDAAEIRGIRLARRPRRIHSHVAITVDGRELVFEMVGAGQKIDRITEILGSCR